MKNLIKVVIAILIVLVLLTACQNGEQKLNAAEKVAQGFGVAWQNKNYAKAYDYFVPSLKEERTKEDFVSFVTASQAKNKFNLIYDKIVLQDKNLAYAYFTYSGEAIVQPKTPAIEMSYIKGSWGINGFASYFTDECASDNCRSELSLEFKEKKEKECRKRHGDNALYDKCLGDYTYYTLSDLNVEYTPIEFQYECDKSTGYRCVLK